MKNTYPVILEKRPQPSMTFSISDEPNGYRRGPTESWVRGKMYLLGVGFLKSSVTVIIDGHRYGPDLVYVDQDRGIYIDIEIDEPYTWRNQPCHCMDMAGKSRESRRDELFTSAGWTVVRFSERQMFNQTGPCVGCISRIIASMDDSFAEEHPQMVSWPSPLEESRWTESQSRQMAKEHYRESYLGISPGHITISGLCRLASNELGRVLSGKWMDSEKGNGVS